METLIITTATSDHIIDERLKGFEINGMHPASTIDYWGTNDKDTIFIQFHNGVSYLYENVQKADIDAMKVADSIGLFMSTLARKGYQFIKLKLALVKSKNQEETQDDE